MRLREVIWVENGAAGCVGTISDWGMAKSVYVVLWGGHDVIATV